MSTHGPHPCHPPCVMPQAIVTSGPLVLSVRTRAQATRTYGITFSPTQSRVHGAIPSNKST